MKKTYLQVFLISILIFIFMFPIYCFCQQQEKFNWGELWLEMDSLQKDLFLVGVRDGILYVLKNVFSEDSSGLKDLSNTKREMFLDYILKRHTDFNDNRDVLKDIITNLYKEPANSYIEYVKMIDIAMKKLKGEDIESLLRKTREEALQN
ncbi:MAG: hypothetical protein MUP85_05875 [Candidatus Lokiarchaeota archaeon]|nr:hypothetical protein [Candidatus Lokiarchaeota archaeon]